MHLHDRIIANQELDFVAKNPVVLGPRLAFSECVLRLATTERAFTIGACRFERCTIEARKPLENCPWNDAWLEATTFRGTFRCCSFGHDPLCYEAGGGMKDCDFRGATLDSCQFFGEQVGTRWPVWPAIVVPAPAKSARRLTALKWPAKLGDWAAVLGDLPEEVAVLVEWAPSLIEELGGTEEKLRELLAKGGIDVGQ
jgi:hypothetical protein